MQVLAAIAEKAADAAGKGAATVAMLVAAALESGSASTSTKHAVGGSKAMAGMAAGAATERVLAMTDGPEERWTLSAASSLPGWLRR